MDSGSKDSLQVRHTREPTASTSVTTAGSSRSIESRSERAPAQHLSRMTSLRRSLSTGVKKSQGAVAHFLGVDHIPEEQQDERRAMWEARRMMMGRRFGARPKSPAPLKEEDVEMTDSRPPPPPDALLAALSAFQRPIRKPSVAEMAWKRISKKVAKPPLEAESRMSVRRKPIERMKSFTEPTIEEVPEALEHEPTDIIMRNERFFDQIEPPIPVSPQRAFSPVSYSPFPSQGPPQSRLSAKRDGFGERKSIRLAMSAPLALPESQDIDETDIPAPSELLRAAIPPRGRKRVFGMSAVMRYFMQPFRKNIDRATTDQMYELLDHRPYFTYWATVVQILVLVVSVSVYGFAPVGFDILETSLALETVDYMEPENFWLGPRAAHLIHLGAKYAPCMRPDERIGDKIAVDRELENHTACCISNDESGCVQNTRAKCSVCLVNMFRLQKTLAKFYKWPNNITERVSGSVCGLDPRYCVDPPSTGAHTWPDDITKWPICKKKADVISRGTAPHMTCEVVGHPCCIGTQGECRITTREYCDFVQGYFHETALLCSQVSCMDKICGMLPFFDPEVPDQFYRVWTAMFLHAGFIHLLITVLFQHYIMRDTEKLTGCIRMGIIYIMSGIGGNLASAIFTPYVAEVGPSGSQFGVFACVIVEIIYSWKLVDRPWIPLLKMLGLAFFLFIVGLVPWTDNYSHIFGFIFGFLLSLALLPYIAFTERERRLKVWICISSMLVAAGLFALLIVLFYIHPVYDCEICGYLNCIPFTENFCDNQKIIIMKKHKEL